MTTPSLPSSNSNQKYRPLLHGAFATLSLAAVIFIARLKSFNLGSERSEGLLDKNSRVTKSTALAMSPSSSELVHASGDRVVYKEADNASDHKIKMYSAHVVSVDGDTRPLSIRRWAELLSEDGSDQVADDLTASISDSPYEAVYFETRPVSSGTASQRHFQFVLVDAPFLKQFCESQGPDSLTFREHLRCTPEKDTCCAFWNLSGDARLIAPRVPGSVFSRRLLGGDDDKTKYAHLAAFVRGASQAQTRELWRKTAREYLNIVDNRSGNVYLSTSGAGVSWLHMRLDKRPKYYTYRPFKTEEVKADEGHWS